MMTTRHAMIETVLGELTAVAEDGQLTGLYYPDHRRRPQAPAFGERVDAAADDVFARTAAELTAFLAGRRRDFTVPARTRGDEFSERVWAMLREIPYGQTTTYGALARRLGDRKLAQRVGRAVGDNPVSIMIPCHRVLGADGSLTGYAGGLERKRFLLELEEPPEAAEARLFRTSDLTFRPAGATTV